MKIIISFLVLIPLVFYIGRSSKETPAPVPENQKLVKFEQLLKEIQDLDIREYENLKTDREKYLKANEIYGKVMQLFLANLGMKLEAAKWKKLSQIKEPMEKECPIVKDSSNDKLCPEPVVCKCEEFGKFKEKIEKEQKVKSVDKAPIDEEKKLSRPNTYFNNIKLVERSSRFGKFLKGIYEGEAIIYGKEKKIVYIKMDLNYAWRKKSWQGSGLIELADDEHGVFSRSRSNGGINDFYAHPETPDYLIVRASPSVFLHLWQKSRRRFSGYIYQRDPKTNKFKLEGKIPNLKKL